MAVAFRILAPPPCKAVRNTSSLSTQFISLGEFPPPDSGGTDVPTTLSDAGPDGSESPLAPGALLLASASCLATRRSSLIVSPFLATGILGLFLKPCRFTRHIFRGKDNVS